MCTRPLLAIVAFLFLLVVVQAGDEAFICSRFTAEYDLYLSHVHVREAISLESRQGQSLLVSGSLYPMIGLGNITFQPRDRVVHSYNGSSLSWIYDPPVSPGENLTYTREWDIAVPADERGIRSLVLNMPQTENAFVLFRTHGVDVVDASVPLDGNSRYVGRTTEGPHYVRYSSSFKIYRYSWKAYLSNSGARKSTVTMNISIPGDGPYQYVLDSTAERTLSDDIGNDKAFKVLELGANCTGMYGVNLTMITWTWRPPSQREFIEGEDLSRFLGPDGSYWQTADPAIADFAAKSVSALNGEAAVSALANAVRNHLSYVQLEERKGALWALDSGVGSCMEHSDLFVACARYLGMPCIYLSGFCGRSSTADGGHSWVAVWLPDRGWVGVDPTWDRRLRLDSGRVVTRVCNSADVAVSYNYEGGDVSISDWRESWDFREISELEALALLEDEMPYTVGFHPAFWAFFAIIASWVLLGDR